MKRFSMLLIAATMICGTFHTAWAVEIVDCWFPPGWDAKTEKAKTIVRALAEESGVIIRPKIARDYPEILSAFSSSKSNLVYVGSFVQAVIRARDLGTPLVQTVNGKEMYSGILVFPKGEDPEKILREYPEQIAFAMAASSGESSAKAATAGRAAIALSSHGASSEAVTAGQAKAAVVKNWWWEANRANYPTLESYEIPGVSIPANPDNVLTASNAVSAEVREKIAHAAIARKSAFGATKMVPFDKSRLEFSLELMKKGKIDPLTYSW